jgi:hypothetical protein
MVKRLECGDVSIPYKFARAAVLEFKQTTGKDITKDADSLSMEDNMQMCYIAIKYGHIAEGLEFNMTWEEFLINDTKYDLLEKILNDINEGAGK